MPVGGAVERDLERFYRVDVRRSDCRRPGWRSSASCVRLLVPCRPPSATAREGGPGRRGTRCSSRRVTRSTTPDGAPTAFGALNAPDRSRCSGSPPMPTSCQAATTVLLTAVRRARWRCATSCVANCWKSAVVRKPSRREARDTRFPGLLPRESCRARSRPDRTPCSGCPS